MSDFNSLVQYTVENISRPVKYIIYKLTEFIRVVDKFVFRQVPTNAASGYATIEKIEGNTVKFNQLVQNGDFSDGTTWWTVSTRLTSSILNNEATFTANDGAGGANKYISQSVNYVSGHKYFISFDWRSDRTSLRLYLSSTVRHIESEIINTWVTFSEILTNDNYDRFCISFENPDMSVGYYFCLRKIQIFDLTAIFGAGNEPTTVADFEAWREQNGLPSVSDYNAGELLSVKMQSVKSVGFNQWDEEWEVGTISANTGQNVLAFNRIRSKNYITILHDLAYYIKRPSNYVERIFFYDANKNFINWTYNLTTIPANAAYIRFNTVENSGGTYNHNICINISDPNKNGTYQPYMTDSADIDVTTITGINPNTNTREVIFPNGMKKADMAGTVKDELDLAGDIATVKVGEVDLSNLGWSYTTAYDYPFFQAQLSDIKTFDSDYVANIICSKYSVRPGTVDYGGANGVSSFGYGTTRYIRVYDTAYTDASAFTNAMQGVMLYYELATPITYTDLQDANGNPLNTRYKVEQGGTEQVLPVNTSTPTTVAPTLTTTYTKDVH